ncbi:4-(cytidine 5'-diphospho)-2-C-methyl-D-erythritol kinase [Entomospira nematocerorum]|uniref:4-diphosphocytidyl-2-C-methyl-D-erythritol kinase n=1 Tax=Entomospira nematocerorum TaxID=2719987 RepID=A0A968KSD5_9SPIO|nr:4-(cytidine 5'-diphospho)-2-C-methyl-D-erythritol kinase [Entomospira nematocera]NIZ46351.1 4-(cytidine 5'-diphospho)-2-C-methyl-D-erythritol kinase [Entomospira nematocera]WDI33844.1 4-(cytidine 5'-diphospho)-2-C-methyl-D-erythritol kinase [Entomospira nematocera]
MLHTMTIITPAKLNLHLQILGSHPSLSGYHELRSIMTKISLYDQLDITIESAKAEHYVLKGFVIDKEKDILYKAYRYFMNRTNITFSLEITLLKKIPQQAGLGGGSSNVGSLLIALNNYFNNPIPATILCSESKILGADIPFFISSHNAAIVEGIGEILTPIPGKKMKFLLIKPEEDMPTPYAFTTLRKQMQLPNPHAITKHALSNIWSANDISQMQRTFSNDFTIILPTQHPETYSILNALRKHPEALWCGMSGSGTTIFALFKSDHIYESEMLQYQSMGYFSTIAETLID